MVEPSMRKNAAKSPRKIFAALQSPFASIRGRLFLLLLSVLTLRQPLSAEEMSRILRLNRHEFPTVRSFTWLGSHGRVLFSDSPSVLGLNLGNGDGFDLEAVLSKIRERQGLGLTSMKERAELSGGSFTIRSVPGTGTRLGARWPLPAHSVSPIGHVTAKPVA